MIEIQESNMVYKPRDDSYFMVETIKTIGLSEDFVEVGCGSGIILLSLLENKPNISIAIGIDINFKAAILTKINAKLNKLDVEIIASTHLSCFRKNGTPSIIIFNPPYLPEDSEIDPHLSLEERHALIGGKYGFEVLLDHIKYIEKHHIGYYIISSLATDFEQIRKKCPGYNIKLINTKKIPFETLWIIKIQMK
jgi:methylase of polypeptide subunit release factors